MLSDQLSNRGAPAARSCNGLRHRTNLLRRTGSYGKTKFYEPCYTGYRRLQVRVEITHPATGCVPALPVSKLFLRLWFSQGPTHV
jgi:hypothetical protein